MSFLDLIKGEFDKITKPIFIKDFSPDSKQINDLEQLLPLLKNEAKKEEIERDIILLCQGISGEKSLCFELKNSFIPMLCLHDVRIEFEGHVAQLDFIVITKKFICIMETKKLYGNIEINRDGDFIRIIRTRGGREYKEGMYSPISQNMRHVKIIKDLLAKKIGHIKVPVFSMVIMANPQTIINKSKAPSDVKKSLYRIDQAVKQLEYLLADKTNEYHFFNQRMHSVANFLKHEHKPISFNNKAKYNLCDDDFIYPPPTLPAEPSARFIPSPSPPIKKTNTDFEKKLKNLRTEIARRDRIPPYYIFNNEEMDELIEKQPKTILELLKVRGFGIKKAEMYGEDIINIFIAK